VLRDLTRLLGGGILLYFGAEWLIAGASKFALSLRVPQLIVGLTVVAYGTSMPEAVVSVEAAIDGHGAVALGNVIGSNIANLGLILGLSTLVRPARVADGLRVRELPVLFAATAALVVVTIDGVVSFVEAMTLLACALGYTAWAALAARSSAVLVSATNAAGVAAEAADIAGAPSPGGRVRTTAICLLGLGLLLLGGSLFVTGATSLALHIGMSERVVGLTIVAIGTSLPELMTSLIAAFRGHSDIAIGSVIGSNIFNVLFCLGAAGVVGTIEVDPAAVAHDLLVLSLMTVVGIVFMRRARVIRRFEGGMLLAAYLAFLGGLVVS
jgi:cation:H+ antiporter